MVLQAFSSPYGTTLPHQEGLETRIMGDSGTEVTHSKVCTPEWPS
jgi:hypothetical protein